MGSSVKRTAKRVLGTLIVLALLVAGALAFLNRQTINDQIAAQQFEPPAKIVSLTESMQLTESGHRIFWASEPTLDESLAFNEHCSKVEHSEEGHVLGCYTGGKIHLFEISDERLNGIIEVTAVHELLHATFARMGDEERGVLADRMRQLYEELAEIDPTLEARMSVYSGLSKTAFANELHSVFGTEVRELPDWLEEHYSKWLVNREAILEYFESYRSVFDDLKSRADTLQSTMSELRADVERRSAEYDEAVNKFNSDWETFLARNDAFEFSDNVEEFDRLLDDFYNRREALSVEMQNLNSDIARYEELRTELLSLSELNHELLQQLDSDLAPPSSAPAT